VVACRQCLIHSAECRNHRQPVFGSCLEHCLFRITALADKSTAIVESVGTRHTVVPVSNSWRAAACDGEFGDLIFAAGPPVVAMATGYMVCQSSKWADSAIFAAMILLGIPAGIMALGDVPNEYLAPPRLVVIRGAGAVAHIG